MSPEALRLPFVEKECVIEHAGKKFESGGSFFAMCSDGRVRGVVYARAPEDRRPLPRMYRNPVPAGWGSVTTWHGEELAKAYFGQSYVNNFGARMRSVRFEIDGRVFHGRYGVDGGAMVRVCSAKERSMP